MYRTIGFMECIQRALHHRGTGQHVAANRNIRAAHHPAPGHAVLAGVLGDAALGVDHVQLAMVAPGVLRQQSGDYGVGRFADTQPRHAVRCVHWIDQRLGGQCGNPTLDVDRQRANGEEAR